MANLKYYNSGTEEWETLVIGKQGPTGPQGVSGNDGALSPNAILNGAFDIWQRGTSVAGSNNATTSYVADRWMGYRSSSAAGSTFSRQLSGLDSIRYCMRVQRDSGNSGTGRLFLDQALDTDSTVPFQGKTTTLSFYARAGANYSAASNNLRVVIFTGTGTDQKVVTGLTGQATLSDTFVTLTTSWQRFSVVVNIASSVTGISIEFDHNPTGTAGASDFFEITGVQLEAGAVATPFRRNAPSIQAELAACMRYYQRITVQDTVGRMSGSTPALSTAALFLIIQHSVRFRAAPASIEWSLVGIGDGANPLIVPSSIALSNPGVDFSVLAISATGLTQLRSYFALANNSASAFYAFSAEL